jgi:outer membrane protein TolC
MDEVIAMALEANLNLKVERLAPAVRDLRIDAALGDFDPSLEVSAIYEDRERRQNTEQEVATNGLTIFQQENVLLDSAIRGRLHTGTGYALEFNNDRLENSLNQRDSSRFSPEYGSDFEFVLTQPLLKDRGTEVNLARVRIAESELRASRHAYYGAVLDVVGQVMGAYVETAFAQDNVGVKRDAVDLATTLRDENNRRLELGVMKPIDVVEAEAAVAQADEALIAAETFLAERRNLLKALVFDDFTRVADLVVEAADPLDPTLPPLDRNWLLARALQRNPQVLQQRETVVQERTRQRYAKNQILPKIDLRGSIGYSGLDGSLGGSLDDFTRRTGPSWSAGLVFSIPWGNRTAKAQLAEAILRYEQASLGVRFTENDVAAALETATTRIDANHRRIAAAQKSVEFAAQAVDSERKRLETGLGTSYDVRRTQEELSAARTRRLAAAAELQKSVIEMWKVVGSIPELDRHVEFVWGEAPQGDPAATPVNEAARVVPVQDSH